MLAIVCPGQGSQTPGFLSPWIEDSEARETLTQFSEFAGTDLTTHGTVSDEKTIRDTAVAQPLIVAASFLCARALGIGRGEAPEGASAEKLLLAGHSVGEIPASALAGVLTEEQALRMIKVRADAMAEAAAHEQTSMAAVIGGDDAEVRTAIEKAGLTPANVNGPGQIVAAGRGADLEELAQNAPARARVIPLSVAGAFHTEFMASAQQRLAEAAGALEPADPQVRLLSNRDGETVLEGREVLTRIVDQVTRPVRWDLCMETMRTRGVTGVLELLPGGTLTGLAKRGLKGTASLAVKTPEDLDAARTFIGEHAAA